MSDHPLDPDVLAMLRSLSPAEGPDVLLEVLALFQADAPARLAALDAALGAGDLPLAGRSAHAIKGGAGNIGARTLYAACKAVEDAARGGHLTEARAAWADMQHESQRVLAAIRDLLA